MPESLVFLREVVGGTVGRRSDQVILPPPPPPPPGVAEDIPATVYRPALNWEADYSTQAAMIASYSGPDQDIKLSNTGTLTLVDDPLDGTRTQKWMRTDMPNGTALTNGVTDNPRMQIEDPRIIVEGDGWWTGFSVIFPADWPVPGPFGSGGYIQIYQFYGAPFGGGATITLTNRGNGTYDTPDGLRWGFNRDNSALATGLAWRYQMERLKRIDIAMRVIAGRTVDTGSVEIWQNTGAGWVQQTLIGGVKRLGCVTIGSVNTTGPNSNELQLYRGLDQFPGTLHHFMTGHARGPSLASVDPHSHDGTWDVTTPPPPPPVNGPESNLGFIEPNGSNVGAGKMPEANRPYPRIEIFGDVTLTGTQSLKDRIVHGRVYCNGANLVENCVIDGGPAPTTGEVYLVQTHGGTGSTIRYCNLAPANPSPRWNGVGTKYFTAEYNNIWRVTDGFSVFSQLADGVTNTKILGNFCPSMIQFRPDLPRNGAQRPETHNDTVQLQGNRKLASDCIIEGNSFDATHSASYEYGTLVPLTSTFTNLAAVMVTANTQAGCSATIKNNWLRGGIFTLNAGKPNSGGILIVTGNRCERPPSSQPTINKSLNIDISTTYTASDNFYLNSDGTTSADRVVVVNY